MTTSQAFPLSQPLLQWPKPSLSNIIPTSTSPPYYAHCLRPLEYLLQLLQPAVASHRHQSQCAIWRSDHQHRCCDLPVTRPLRPLNSRLHRYRYQPRVTAHSKVDLRHPSFFLFLRSCAAVNRLLRPGISYSLWRIRKTQRRIPSYLQLLRPPAVVQQTA